MPLRVLVVDDCPDTRTTLRMLLRQWGHESREAADGPAALKAAREFRPDVVLLDLGLPGDIDGYGVARRLRADESLRGALLVAVTGFGQSGDVDRCREAGFDHHLLKPFDARQLGFLLSSRAGDTAPGKQHP
jgi:CheY-like chemotaxis protein